MLAVAGVLLLALCALSIHLSAAVFHHPEPPAWARREGPATWATLAIMAFGATGAGALLKFGAQFRSQGFTIVDAVLCVAIVAAAVTVIGRRRFFGAARRSSLVPIEQGPAGPPANDPRPPVGDRRRAA